MECWAGSVPVLECTHGLSVVRAVAGRRRSTATGVSYGCIGMITLIIKMAERGLDGFSELEFLNILWGLGGNRVGIGLSYRPARLHRLAELISLSRVLGSLKVLKFGLWSF